MKIILFFLFCCNFSFAQLSKNELDQKLENIYTGKANLVLQELSELKNKSPKDPSVLFLDAVLTVDGETSANKFLNIADNYPEYFYRAEALNKVYQFYYTRGEYIKADQVFNKIKIEYPESSLERIENLQTKFSKSKDVEMYSIQCGAFADKTNADKLIQHLDTLNIKAEIKIKSSQQNLFFVVVSGFVTIDEAQNYILKLKNENNISAIIFKNN